MRCGAANTSAKSRCLARGLLFRFRVSDERPYHPLAYRADELLASSSGEKKHLTPAAQNELRLSLADLVDGPDLAWATVSLVSLARLLEQQGEPDAGDQLIHVACFASGALSVANEWFANEMRRSDAETAELTGRDVIPIEHQKRGGSPAHQIEPIAVMRRRA
jgi:hypothetical protein